MEDIIEGMPPKINQRGRKKSHNYHLLTVGGNHIKCNKTAVSCAINWARRNGLDWKFKSTQDEHGNYYLWRTK